MEQWDKRRSESNKAYMAFLTYRNLGPLRTIKNATAAFYGDYTKSRHSRLGDWSRYNDWVERASAWDRHHLDRRALEREVQSREMADRQADTALLFEQKAREYLEELDPKDLTPSQAVAFFEIGAKIERASLGEAAGDQVGKSAQVDSVIEQMRNNPRAAELEQELVSLYSGNKTPEERAKPKEKPPPKRPAR